MGKEKLSKLYDAYFYSRHLEGMSNSAKEVLDLLYKIYQPKSVIDIGCGQGSWLALAERLGSIKLKGLDGSWVKSEELLSKNIDFIAVDFDNSIPEIGEKYDLCISLEVAEHISEKNAEKFIDMLCKASDIVLFSAAIKYQGGTNHINEQWQSYWIDLFNSHNYECFDIFRARLWRNKSVEWWYRQNTFLFVAPDNPFLKFEDLRALEKSAVDIIHPANYEYKIKSYENREISYENKIKSYENKIKSYENKIQYPTLLFCLVCIKRFIWNKIARLRRINV